MFVRLALAATLLAAAPVGAQTPASPAAQAIDRLLGPDRADRPGGVVLVARGDAVVYQRAFGAADLEQGTRISPDTRFHVASLSKQFTALAAALLAQDGRIDLDADIRTYLPELRDYGTPIRVRHLINHTSGLRDQWDLTVLSGTNMQSLIRQDALVALIGAQESLNFAPGTAYRYSNSGYALLAEIVARRSGTPFRQFLQQRVFAPLGMTDTLVADSAAEIIPRRAQSYRVLPNGRVELFRLNFENYGATSLTTTAGDLFKWARELLRPRVFDAALIASLSAPSQLSDGTPLGYGMGVTTAPVAGLRTIAHGGADAGYRAFFAVYPERDAAVIMMFNSVVDVARLNEQVARAFLNPPQPAPAVLAPTDLASFAGTYASGWAPVLRLEVQGTRLVRTGGQEPQAANFRDDGTVTFGESLLPFRPLRSAAGTVIAWDELPPGIPPIRYARLVPATPLAAELSGLAGEYRSGEVDATWWITAEGGQLFVSTLRAPRKNPLVPIDRDRFEAGGFARLAFVRDASGRATGFMVTTGRLNGLRFDRR